MKQHDADVFTLFLFAICRWWTTATWPARVALPLGPVGRRAHRVWRQLTPPVPLLLLRQRRGGGVPTPGRQLQGSAGEGAPLRAVRGLLQ